jgi:hypothetical protein
MWKTTTKIRASKNKHALKKNKKKLIEANFTNEQ